MQYVRDKLYRWAALGQTIYEFPTRSSPLQYLLSYVHDEILHHESQSMEYRHPNILDAPDSAYDHFPIELHLLTLPIASRAVDGPSADPPRVRSHRQYAA